LNDALQRHTVAAIAYLEHQECVISPPKDLLAFDDFKTFKAWLKTLRRQPRMADIDELPF
jgi:hypothetical protein